MLHLILKFYEKAQEAVNMGVTLANVLSLDVKQELARMKIIKIEDFEDLSDKLDIKIDQEFENIPKSEEGGESS
jgi:vacuolar-type H+-ATPase catalytic subunit A/Vma1